MDTITQGTPQGGEGQPAEKPAGLEVPANEADVSSLLDKLNQPGGEATPPVAPETKPEVAPEQAQIPDKFKNPDGTVNTDAMAKSYLASEKQLSQMFQERGEWKKTSEQLANMQDYVKKIDEWREATIAEQEAAKPEGEGEYTPEEIEDMKINPRKYIKNEVAKELKSYQKEQAAEAKLTGDINAAVNYGRANVDGFKQLEPEIAKAMESPAYAKHPESVQQAYYATLGQKVPILLKQAKDMAFSEGYKKHAEEMGKHVEGGGKSSQPIAPGALTKEMIDGMSVEEMEKRFPNIDNRLSRESTV